MLRFTIPMGTSISILSEVLRAWPLVSIRVRSMTSFPSSGSSSRPRSMGATLIISGLSLVSLPMVPTQNSTVTGHKSMASFPLKDRKDNRGDSSLPAKRSGNTLGPLLLNPDVITGTDLIDVLTADNPNAVAAGQAWNWTTNRHWGELFSTQANTFEGGPGGSNSPSDVWTLIVENHGDGDIIFWW